MLITPLNKIREAWERPESVTQTPSPQAVPAPAFTAEPHPKRAKVLGKGRRKEELPRGIHRLGRFLEVYLTHADARGERRSVGNFSVKMADQQRQIWQREIAEDGT